MLQGGVQDLMHQDKIQLIIAQFVQKLRVEIDPVPVRRRGFAPFIQREFHMHDQKPVEAVRTQDPHP